MKGVISCTRMKAQLMILENCGTTIVKSAFLVVGVCYCPVPNLVLFRTGLVLGFASFEYFVFTWAFNFKCS